MLKMILLAGTMTIAAPALAQTMAPADPGVQTAPQTTTVDPSTTVPQTAVDPATSTTAPATAAAPAQTAEAAPAADGTQVASAVDTQFGTYDKNADGKLSQAEFSSWMVALKTASDPATKAGSAETKKWVGAAFAQADTDKNKSLDKAEVTGFLTKG